MLNGFEKCERLARKLPLKDRSELIESLINSLDELDEAECEKMWIEEAEKRYREYKAGNISGRPAREVLHGARAKLNETK